VHPACGCTDWCGAKDVIGGEIRGLTKTLVEARTEAIDRMVEAARACDVNAVLAVRYDVMAAQDSGTDICAYGTAAVIAPTA
jgi:uncharacterized protein YbjQ (UPF0145 family)